MIKDGQTFDPLPDRWVLQRTRRGGDTLYGRFDDLRANARKRWLVDRGRLLKAATVMNYIRSISRAAIFLRRRRGDTVDWVNVTAADCQAFLKRDLEQKNGVRGNDFAVLRLLYRWGLLTAELSDFSEDVWRQISDIRAPGNLKGQRVLGMSAESGPLAPEELEQVHAAIQAGRGQLRDLVCVQLLVELGIRPIQAIGTLWRSLRDIRAPKGDRAGERLLTLVDVPLAKERGAEISERTKPVSTLLAQRLRKLAPERPSSTTPLLWWLRPGRQSSDLVASLQRWSRDAGLRSPRTLKSLHLTGYRFRYTIGVEAARNGASKVQLMTLLDHSDLQNVDVYVDAAGVVMRNIEQSLEAAFEPSIRRFLGRVEARTPQQDQAIIPGTFAQLPQMEPLHVGIGRCGADPRTDGVCKLAPPIACYTCPKFVAFRDAPHRQIAESLESIARSQAGVTGGRMTSELLPALHAVRQLVHSLEPIRETDE